MAATSECGCAVRARSGGSGCKRLHWNRLTTSTQLTSMFVFIEWLRPAQNFDELEWRLSHMNSYMKQSDLYSIEPIYDSGSNQNWKDPIPCDCCWHVSFQCEQGVFRSGVVCQEKPPERASVNKHVKHFCLRLARSLSISLALPFSIGRAVKYFTLAT